MSIVRLASTQVPLLLKVYGEKIPETGLKQAQKIIKGIRDKVELLLVDFAGNELVLPKEDSFEVDAENGLRIRFFGSCKDTLVVGRHGFDLTICKDGITYYLAVTDEYYKKLTSTHAMGNGGEYDWVDASSSRRLEYSERERLLDTACGRLAYILDQYEPGRYLSRATIEQLEQWFEELKAECIRMTTVQLEDFVAKILKAKLDLFCWSSNGQQNLEFEILYCSQPNKFVVLRSKDIVCID